MTPAGQARTTWSKALGCIADDLTGATDVASAIRRAGLSVRLTFGAPTPDDLGSDSPSHAVVVALPIRSVTAEEATAQVREAVNALREIGVSHFFNKYCSTFDSTPRGNIGPITDEMMDITAHSSCVHAPTYPENGRTVYQGNLFVGDQPLNESPMRHHPRNPMDDSNLVRVLAAQTVRQVSLLPWQYVAAGQAGQKLSDLRRAGAGHVIADALTERDLDLLAEALDGALPAGGAPFGAAVARAMFSDELAEVGVAAGGHPNASVAGGRVVIAGSASLRTKDQISSFSGPVLRLTLDDARRGASGVADIANRASALMNEGPVLVAAEELATHRGVASSSPSETDATAMETALAYVALQLVDAGADRMIVAGGETSGAVATALGLRAVDVGPEIAPGVPWTFAAGRNLAIAFKSGNFGSESFFNDAFEVLGEKVMT